MFTQEILKNCKINPLIFSKKNHIIMTMLNNKKILIIRLSAIGDTIHTLPMIYALKKQYPNCRIGWVVESKAKMFVEDNPLIDKYFVIDKKRKNFFKIIKQLRKEKYDIALDPQQLLKSGIVLGLCGAKRKITLSGGREFSWIFANEIVKAKTKLFDINYHVVKRNLELCEYLGCKTEEISFPMPELSEEEKEVTKSLLPQNGKPVVALSPATTWRNKHLPAEFWANVVNHISDRADIIFTGSIKDTNLINNIIEKSDSKNLTNLAGETNLLELRELFSSCRIVITPDSGSAHIAWASTKPYVITLFCATSAKRTGPFDNHSGSNTKYFSIQSKAQCSPCMKKKCKSSTNKDYCTNEFNIDSIFKLIDNILK